MKLHTINERLNPIKGGIGDDLEEKDVDKKQLKMGIEVEMEHADDPEISKDIAIDHLAEHPDDYYTKLKKAGL
jgi:hypothetical protein